MAPAKKAAKKSAKKATKKAPAKKGTKKATKKGTKKATKKGTKKATKKASAGSGGSVVVASKLRDAVRGHDARMSSDLVEAVDAEVKELIARAAKRAKDNGRSTIRSSDL